MADASVTTALTALTGTLKGVDGMVRSLNAELANMMSILKSGGTPGSVPTMGSSVGSLAAPTPPRFSSDTARQGYYNLLSGLASGAGAIAGALPTTQEAVDAQAIANRMRFYGSERAYKTEDSSYLALRQMSSMGVALNPLDAMQAVNTATGYGFLPGLKNFGAGSGFSGFMGSAALASALSPGLGITGGAQVMASLQRPDFINKARMFGIQMRNTDSQPIDLKNIINQLYDILSKSATVTKENIAISVMPGNALDNILTQYFGLDQNVRNVIIDGLIQKASGQDLTKAGLQATGGLTNAILSTGNRASSELNLIQTFAGKTASGMIVANNVLQHFYNSLVNNKNNKRDMGAPGGVAQLTSLLDTIGGARSGAGQLILESLVNTGAGLGQLTWAGAKALKTSTKMPLPAKLLIGAGTAFGVGLAGNKIQDMFKSLKASGSTPSSAGVEMTGEAGVTPTQYNQAITSPIIVNVFDSSSSDPYGIGQSTGQAVRSNLMW